MGVVPADRTAEFSFDEKALRILGIYAKKKRKRHIARREMAPDPVYESTFGTKFLSSMMRSCS